MSQIETSGGSEDAAGGSTGMRAAFTKAAYSASEEHGGDDAGGGGSSFRTSKRELLAGVESSSAPADDGDLSESGGAPQKVYSTKYFGALGYWHRLTDNYTKTFVMQLMSNYLFVKGFTMGLVASVLFPFFHSQMSVPVSGRQYQIFRQVIYIPWSIKAWMGSTSDLYPLLGFHKRSYMLGATVLGTTALCILSFVQFSTSTAVGAALLMFMVMFQISLCDLLCEGKYAEMMRKLPHTKGDAVSFVWVCITFGSMLAAPIVGPFSDHYNPRYLFIIALPFAAQIVYPLVRGYLPEDFVPKEQRKIKWDKFRDNKHIFYLACAMAVGAMGMGIVNLTSGDAAILGYAVGISAVLCGLGFLWLPRLLAMCNFYMFLQETLYIQIAGALDFWYTSDEVCVPGGPHFDYSFYTTIAGVVGSIAGIIGILVFQRVMSDWSFRACFWVPTLMRMVASLFDIFLITRSNIAIGFPDHYAYLFGDAFIQVIALMMFQMPAVILTSKICPRGYESTTYALLAGFQNFGQNVSQSIGVFMLGAFGVRTEAPCNYDNLSWLVFAAHFCLPFVMIPLTFVLLPNAKLSDDLEKGVFESMDPRAGEDGRLRRLGLGAGEDAVDLESGEEHNGIQMMSLSGKANSSRSDGGDSSGYVDSATGKRLHSSASSASPTLDKPSRRRKAKAKRVRTGTSSSGSLDRHERVDFLQMMSESNVFEAVDDDEETEIDNPEGDYDTEMDSLASAATGTATEKRKRKKKKKKKKISGDNDEEDGEAKKKKKKSKKKKSKKPAEETASGAAVPNSPQLGARAGHLHSPTMVIPLTPKAAQEAKVRESVLKSANSGVAVGVIHETDEVDETQEPAPVLEEQDEKAPFAEKTKKKSKKKKKKTKEKSKSKKKKKKSKKSKSSEPTDDQELLVKIDDEDDVDLMNISERESDLVKIDGAAIDEVDDKVEVEKKSKSPVDEVDVSSDDDGNDEDADSSDGLSDDDDDDDQFDDVDPATDLS